MCPRRWVSLRWSWLVRVCCQKPPVSSLRAADGQGFIRAGRGLPRPTWAGCQRHRSCEKIAALPPDVRKGSAFPYIGLDTKAFSLGRLPESPRLSAHQAAQPQPR
jgi:hypothetical protein